MASMVLVSTSLGFTDPSHARQKRNYVPPGVNNTASLAWIAPPVPVSGYRVYYGTKSGAYDQPPGGGMYSPTVNYTVVGLTTGYTYYFAVTAIDRAGIESARSNEVSKTMP
jgi:fibronectin type 3 domain-containing protein